MNYYSYMHRKSNQSVAMDAIGGIRTQNPAPSQAGRQNQATPQQPTSGKSSKVKSLEEHDKQFHPNGYKPGDKCKFREALEEYGDSDVLEQALNYKQEDNPYYLTQAHSSARFVRPIKPTEKGFEGELVMRATLPQGTDPNHELEAMYGLAEQNIGTLNTITDNAAKAAGAEAAYRPPNNAYKGLPIKTWMRAKQKADSWNRKNDGSLGDYTQLNDLIGSTLILPDNGSYADAVEHLDANVRKFGGQIAQIKPLNLTTGKPGYRDLKVIVKFPNGGTGEIIVMEDFMKKQKFENEGHAAYEAFRTLDGMMACGDTSVSGLLDDVDEMMNMLYERDATKMDDKKFEEHKKTVGDAINRVLANPDSFMPKMPEGFRPDIQDPGMRQKMFEQARTDNLEAIKKVMQKDPAKNNTSRWDRMRLADPKDRITPASKQPVQQLAQQKPSQHA